IMIDGIRNGSRTTYESFNIESIEIAKGPSGAYSGAGATGGSINLVSKTPQPGVFDDAALSVGTGGYVRGTLDSNREFGDIGVRLNLMTQHADDLNGRKGVSSERYGIAPSISYKIDETSKLTAGLYYYKSKDMPDYGQVMSSSVTAASSAFSGLSKGSGTWSDPYEPVDVDTDVFYGVNNRDFRTIENASGYLRFDHDFANGLKWTTTLRHNRDTNRYVVTAPGRSASGVTVNSPKSSNRLTETTSFNSALSGESDLFNTKNSYSFGVELTNTTTKSGSMVADAAATASNTALAALQPSDPDNGVAWNGSYSDGPYTSKATTKTRSIYAIDTVTLSPQWEVNAGLRYDSFDVDSVPIGSGTGTSLSSNNNFVNGMLGLVYKPAENGSIYFAYGTSANPSGLGSNLGGDDAIASTNEDLDPEKTRSYELGTKWALLNQQLTLTGAVFRIDKTNARTYDELGNIAMTANTVSKGIELGAAGQITDRWGVWAGYTFTDSKTKGAYYTAGRGTVTVNPANDRQTLGIPRNSLSLWSTYDITDQLTLGGGATYTDKRWVSYTSGAISRLPATVRIDLMASYKVNDDTSVQVNINNVFDENLYNGYYAAGFVNVEPGRNVSLTLRHTF
ncbi:MAG TPA: TonB-dependent siderophore receptor, partial [Paenirhodobacter sp.]